MCATILLSSKSESAYNSTMKRTLLFSAALVAMLCGCSEPPRYQIVSAKLEHTPLGFDVVYFVKLDTKTGNAWVSKGFGGGLSDWTILTNNTAEFNSTLPQ